MSIETTFGNVFLLCDMCGEEADEIFEDFYEAVAYKQYRRNGWRSTKDACGEWIDVCPKCAKENLL